MAAGLSHARTCAVVGNGMVGARFCELLRERDPRGLWRMVVFADEPVPAYDRIRLSKALGAAALPELTIRPRSWYEDNSISLRCGERVESLAPDEHRLTTSGGRELRYDALVLATGASPVVPPIPGVHAAGVMTFRTLEDARRLRRRVAAATRVAVIGGGLLGLEAASACRRLGASVTVLERSHYPLSRQLDETTAAVLRAHLEGAGIELRCDCDVSSIAPSRDGLTVECGDDPPVDADLVVIAIGVRPRDELAERAGLSVGVRGGFLVDERLRASADDVYAIGDCAAFRGDPCGLVAPGYEMARVVANRLAGADEVFAGIDASCRLDVHGASVAAVGDATRDGREFVWEAPGRRRVLVVEERGIVAARGVGSWPGLARVQDHIAAGRRMPARAYRRFERTGELDGLAPVSIEDLSATAIVCHCAGVRREQLEAAMASGAREPLALARATRASTLCGSCAPLVAELCGARPTPRPAPSRGLAIASVGVLGACIAIVAAGPIPFADSVSDPSAWLSELWRETDSKKFTGFALLGATAAGLVLSARKRIRWFRVGTYASFRLVHAAVGLACAGLVVAHTGMRLGDNFNLWLMLVFLASLATGAVVGLVAAVAVGQSSWAAPVARRYRRGVTWLHLLVLWLLPVFIGFHVLTAYYF